VTTESMRGRTRAARRLAAFTSLALTLAAAVPPVALAQTSDGGETTKSPAATGDSSSPRSPEGADVDTDLRAQRHVRRGALVSFSGRLAGGNSGETVVVERRGRGGGWRTVARTTTRSGGRFTASWRPSETGRFRVRARPLGEALAARGGLTDVEGVNVYRPGHASWYGPGLYGNRTACGRTIRPSTLGVAHKRLPCGTRVTFRYGSRTVTVPVIDRGPFVGGREWDLTAATKRALAFPSTGIVWSTR
jgi:rare lipoprotein A